MKGTFFQKPIEYNLDIEGETWRQGDEIKGKLVVKNLGTEELDLSSKGVTLALTDSKKFKAKSDKAFKVDGKLPFPAGTKLAPSSEQELNWSFSLSSDCPITEKSSSLYLLCGDQEDLFDGGHLELQIEPVEIIMKYVEIFENFFRFKRKALKNKKGFVEIQYTCPGGKELGKIDKLNQHIKLMDQKLEIKWLFKVKKLAYDQGQVVHEKVEKTFEQSLESKQYKMFGDAPNQDGIISSINEALDQVKKKSFF